MASDNSVDYLTISLRQNAVLVSESDYAVSPSEAQSGVNLDHTLKMVTQLANLGFGLEEPLFNALSRTSEEFQNRVFNKLRVVMGLDKNWTPLVKNWLVPTGESIFDYFKTFAATLFETGGVEMPCGHVIPDGSFPLHRYHGCPFCKTPFEFGELEQSGRGSGLRLLGLWTDEDPEKFLHDLLASVTPLDATQVDSLKMLMCKFDLPSPLQLGMKETLAAVVDVLVQMDKAKEVAALLKSPTDILRYLWYKQTGSLQILEPRNIALKKAKNSLPFSSSKEERAKRLAVAFKEEKQNLKLKYSRKECRQVAKWINDLPMSVESMAETMHAKRGMWVRFIRALRLHEYGKRSGLENLKRLLHIFYNQDYEVWTGRLNNARLAKDYDATMGLLKQRPGAFSRSLFANMLWFDDQSVLDEFKTIARKVPARLLLSLGMNAESYFDKHGSRYVRPLGGNGKTIATNPRLGGRTQAELDLIVDRVQGVCLEDMTTRFREAKSSSATMYIEPRLFKMPLPIGDRSKSIQGLPVSLMGTRFPVDGDSVRLFMSWGKGLRAQHLDMDLSCMVAYDEAVECCSYSELTILGCQHSGDIINIPDRVGTAEYIELDLSVLKKNEAKYVAFTCNSYSTGELAVNMVVGWMNSSNEMVVSEKTGVAYDPSAVQHQVEITQDLSKALVFGVLDVANMEVVWLELPFGGPVVQELDLRCVKGLLKRLESKMTIGHLLELKADAQDIEIVPEQSPDNPADESYTVKWGLNAAAVSQLLID